MDVDFNVHDELLGQRATKRVIKKATVPSTFVTYCCLAYSREAGPGHTWQVSKTSNGEEASKGVPACHVVGPGAQVKDRLALEVMQDHLQKSNQSPPTHMTTPFVMSLMSM